MLTRRISTSASKIHFNYPGKCQCIVYPGQICKNTKCYTEDGINGKTIHCERLPDDVSVSFYGRRNTLPNSQGKKRTYICQLSNTVITR